MSTMRKIFYITFTAALTSTTIAASYWQTNRYFQSKQRWATIAQQLSLQNPPQLASLTKTDLFPLKYVSVKGQLSKQFMLISRARESRVGFLIVKSLSFENQEGNKKSILAVVGWIPEEYSYKSASIQEGVYKGILRDKQKTDYLHEKMKKIDLEKFNICTFINVDKAIADMGLSKDHLQTDFYLELLRQQDTAYHYPYQYSVDNFQLPYLTPEKHRAYATFWGLTSLVGLSAIFKVIRMK